MFRCCCCSWVRSFDLTPESEVEFLESTNSAKNFFICENVFNADETLETRGCLAKLTDGVWSLSRTLASALCYCKKDNASLGDSSDHLLDDVVSTVSQAKMPENKQEILSGLISCADTADFHAELGIFRRSPNSVQLNRALQDPERYLVTLEQEYHNHILHAGVIKAMLRKYCLTEEEKLSMVHMAGLSEQEISKVEPTLDTTLALLESMPKVKDDQFPTPLRQLFGLLRKIITAQLELTEDKRATALSLANSISGSLVPLSADPLLTLKYPIVLAAVLTKAIDDKAVSSEICYDRRGSSCSLLSQQSFDDYL